MLGSDLQMGIVYQAAPPLGSHGVEGHEEGFKLISKDPREPRTRLVRPVEEAGLGGRRDSIWRL